MSNIISVGYTTEGTTDQRFLESIIKNTVIDIAFECNGLIEVYDPVYYTFPKANSFADSVINIAQTAYEHGILILCVHADADDVTDSNVLTHKIDPAFRALDLIENDICKIIAPIIPVTMSESWMLADKELLKSEIGTTMSDLELNINRDPETIADPKEIIKEAIRIAQGHLPRRRDKTTIGELYQSVGQKITIDKLETLSSFRKFKDTMRSAFIALNYLH